MGGEGCIGRLKQLSALVASRWLSAVMHVSRDLWSSVGALRAELAPFAPAVARPPIHAVMKVMECSKSWKGAYARGIETFEVKPSVVVMRVVAVCAR